VKNIYFIGFITLIGLALASTAQAVMTVNPGVQLNGSPCKPLTFHDNIVDYRRTDSKAKWHIHDSWQAHIAPALKQMKTVSGKGVGGSASGNLHFVLERRPNDIRALKALIDYSFIIKKHPNHVPLFNQPECYLQAATIYAPDDPSPYMLYGYYLMKLKRYNLAIEKYRKALAINPRAIEPLYNIGLAYYRLGKMEMSRKYAMKAYSRGFPLHWLRKALANAGHPIGK